MSQHEHLSKPRDLSFRPDLLFLDSGGYEISKDQDLSAVEIPRTVANSWSLQQLTEILDNWPNEIATVLVSYDHPAERKPFGDQVKSARDLFKGRPHLYTFLLKPQTHDEQTLNNCLREAMANATELQSFDIIGVTEKEIGRSPLERMVRIARLRTALDDARVNVPIHVFGALDPLSACLYFLAGAEIFDGQTWIRYAYDDNGCCVYGSNHGAIEYGLDIRENDVKARFMSQNVYRLLELQRKLREFDVTGNYEKLEPHAKLLTNAIDSLETELQKGVV